VGGQETGRAGKTGRERGGTGGEGSPFKKTQTSALKRPIRGLSLSWGAKKKKDLAQRKVVGCPAENYFLREICDRWVGEELRGLACEHRFEAGRRREKVKSRKRKGAWAALISLARGMSERDWGPEGGGTWKGRRWGKRLPAERSGEAPAPSRKERKAKGRKLQTCAIQSGARRKN